MMGLVKYQEVDLAHPDKSIEQGLVEDFRRAHNDHVLSELISPGHLVPEIRAHGAKNVCHVLIKVVS